ncbi:MAG: DNA mismatch repair endonuclease MutL [Clostridia bacterium]|nr:DNA mismatch repair endonuclease MutL [Clostridia bacterium]
MGSIVLLDDLTINKIAAGEVIERPANVVKELVENSIDAGATSISVEIENGGITYIRITDNGKGISPDDVEIAFERHATSKIRKAADLVKVSTMGFRGEALASIAAIAKVELISRTADSELGTRIVVEGGKTILIEECGAPVGTTITVKELFFNTPVRYKFLKRDFTEGGYIEDAVSRIALINPNISFKMTNNKKEILRTSGNGDIAAVVYSIYGKDIAQNLIDVEYDYEGIKITGVTGKPEIARSNRANQLFYINGRYIKDKILSAAAEEAYRTLIPHGKYGFCILNVQMNPELVDVNVHPAKLEVRFSEEGKVFKAVNGALKTALLKQDITSEATVPGGESEKEEKKEETFTKTEHSKGLFDIFRPRPVEKRDNVIVADFGNRVEEEKEAYHAAPKSESLVDELFTNSSEANYQDGDSSAANYQANENSKEGNAATESAEMNQTVEEKPVEMSKKSQQMFEDIAIIEEKAKVPEYKILGVAFLTYIFLQLENDVYIIDQHAAHERVLFEKVKENFYKNGGKEAQMLLLPDIIELSKHDMRTVREHMDLFQNAGFEIEEFGDNTIRITSVPSICFEMDTRTLFMDILDGFDITNRTTKQEVEQKFLATVACKAAIKAGMHIEEREIRGLLDQLLVLENPFTCPHGRPTAIRITRAEIEKKFKRR